MPSSTDVISLTSVEVATLASFETVIQQGLDSFVEVGSALAKIRDGRLYRAEFSTFEDYCQTRWSLGRNYVNRLVAAAEVVADVVPIGTKPKSESQARPLASVPKEERAEVWQEVVKTAPKDDAGEPVVTAKHVEKIVARHQWTCENCGGHNRQEDDDGEFCGDCQDAPEPVATEKKQIAAREFTRLIKAIEQANILALDVTRETSRGRKHGTAVVDALRDAADAAREWQKSNKE